MLSVFAILLQVTPAFVEDSHLVIVPTCPVKLKRTVESSQTVCAEFISISKFPPFIWSLTITSVAVEGEGQPPKPPIVNIALNKLVPGVKGLVGV